MGSRWSGHLARQLTVYGSPFALSASQDRRPGPVRDAFMVKPARFTAHKYGVFIEWFDRPPSRRNESSSIKVPPGREIKVQDFNSTGGLHPFSWLRSADKISPGLLRYIGK